MRPRHLMTAALAAMVLSCQGPAAVLAQGGAPDPVTRPAASPPAGPGLEAAPRRARQAIWKRMVRTRSRPAAGPPSAAGMVRASRKDLRADSPKPRRRG